MNDDEKILQACRLRDEGEFLAARREFMEIAEHTEDSVTKASTLLYNIPVLAALGEFELAADHIAEVARILESERKTALHTQDAEQQLRFLEVEFDLEDAYLAWAGGKNQEAATKFSRLLVKHSEEFRKPEFRLGDREGAIRIRVGRLRTLAGGFSNSKRLNHLTCFKRASPTIWGTAT
jgi:hypothetical protein